MLARYRRKRTLLNLWHEKNPAHCRSAFVSRPVVGMEFARPHNDCRHCLSRSFRQPEAGRHRIAEAPS